MTLKYESGRLQDNKTSTPDGTPNENVDTEQHSLEGSVVPPVSLKPGLGTLKAPGAEPKDWKTMDKAEIHRVATAAMKHLENQRIEKQEKLEKALFDKLEEFFSNTQETISSMDRELHMKIDAALKDGFESLKEEIKSLFD